MNIVYVKTDQKIRAASDEYEICILCHKKTDVLTDTPIASRAHYIRGCGQLCRNCYLEISDISSG